MAAASDDNLLLGRYRLMDACAGGGFALVQEAWDTRLNRKVAIKRIRIESSEQLLGQEELPAEAAGSAFTSQMTQGLTVSRHAVERGDALVEARSLASQGDASIVTIYDFEVQGDEAFLIMEYIDGISLAELLAQYEDYVNLDVAATVFRSVAHALEVAHKNQVLHLDIKPQNILISKQGAVKVVDFGIATLMNDSGCGWAHAGTHGYMPLEQLSGQEVDVRTDEWALAAVMYELLTGSNPFVRETPEQEQAFLEGPELILPSLCWDSLDEGIDDALFKALEPAMEDRYVSVARFRQALLPFLGDPQEGEARLTALLCDDYGFEFEDFDECELPEERPPRRSLVECVPEGVWRALPRCMPVLGCAFLAVFALSNIHQTDGLDNPLFWAPLAAVCLAAALVPHVGVLLALLLLSAAVALSASFPVGLFLGIASALWWFAVGRKEPAAPNCVLALPLAGAIGLGQLAPLLAGFNLRPKQAVATTLYTVLLGTVLAAFGSFSLLGWDALGQWVFMHRFGVTAFLPLSSEAGAPLGYLASLVQVLQLPPFWCVAASWLAAAALVALFRLRRTKLFAVLGVLMGVLALGLGLCLAALLASGQQTYLPSIHNAIFTIIPAAIMLVSCVVLRFPGKEAVEEDA